MHTDTHLPPTHTPSHLLVLTHTHVCLCRYHTQASSFITHPHTPIYTPFNTHVYPPTTAHTHTLTGASSPHVLTHTHTHTLYTVYNTHALKHILAHIHTLPFTHPPTPSHDRPYTAPHAHSYALT